MSARRKLSRDSLANGSSREFASFRRPKRGATIDANVSVFSAPGGPCDSPKTETTGQMCDKHSAEWMRSIARVNAFDARATHPWGRRRDEDDLIAARHGFDDAVEPASGHGVR